MTQDEMIGKTLGNYKILAKLGGGGMGEVYKACHKKDPSIVRAVKVIRPELAQDKDFETRFERECSLVLKLKHPHIVQGHDFGTEQDQHYLLTEYVKGETLHERLNREKRLSPEATVKLAIDVCSALEHAHKKGVIHRDLKPGNIMLREGTDEAVLTDFGIVKMVGEGSFLKTMAGKLESEDEVSEAGRGGTVSGLSDVGRGGSGGGGVRKGSSPGTSAYMSPEQHTGREMTERSDIYQLGAVMYECLTGKKPLGWVEAPSKLNPEVKTQLEDVVRRCLAEDPSERYPSAASLFEGLQAAQSGVRPASPPPAPAKEMAVVPEPKPAPVKASEPPRRSPAPKPVMPDGKDDNRQEAPPSKGQDAGLPGSGAEPSSRPRARDWLLVGVAVFGLIYASMAVSKLILRSNRLGPALILAPIVLAPMVGNAGFGLIYASMLVSEVVSELKLNSRWNRPGPAIVPAPISQKPKAPAKPKTVPVVEGKAGIKWVLMRGGSFLMGLERGQSYEKPRHKVSLSAFRMAKSETTVGQYKACVDAGECSHPDGGGRCNWGRSDHPVNCVDWEQARRFCAWAGGRLPTEAEWEYAARSLGKEREYPWGDEKATCDRAVISYGGHGCGRDFTWPACSKAKGNTDQDLCDMAGNVGEWVSDWYASDYYRSSPERNPQGPASGEYRGVRGGSWWDDNAGFCRAAVRNGGPPQVRGINQGFRCAAPIAISR